MKKRAQKRYSLTVRPDGGSRGMKRNNHRTTHMTYPVNHQQTGSDPLERIRRALRQILEAVADPTPSESQMVWDMTSRERYGFKSILHIAELAARADGPAADAFPEALRGIIYAQRRPTALTWCEAFDRETLKQGEADLTADRFQRDQSAAVRDVAIEAHAAHLSELRVLLDTLYHGPPMSAKPTTSGQFVRPMGAK